jgi:hypothetical protein
MSVTQVYLKYVCAWLLLLQVENGKCTIVYTGPPQIAVGITSAIKDKFPDIKDITYLDA